MNWAIIDQKGVVAIATNYQDAKRLSRPKDREMVECKTFTPYIIVANGKHYNKMYFTTDTQAKAELKKIARNNTGGRYSRFDKEYHKGKNIWTIEDTRKARKRGLF